MTARTLARVAGVLYLVTFVTSIPALALKRPYLQTGAGVDALRWAAALEVVLAGRRLEVRDRGPGFGADDPMRSFERFRRGGGKPGHGLGLALVQRICTACGWTVRAANRADGGACLTLDFGSGPGSVSV